MERRLGFLGSLAGAGGGILGAISGVKQAQNPNADTGKLDTGSGILGIISGLAGAAGSGAGMFTKDEAPDPNPTPTP